MSEPCLLHTLGSRYPAGEIYTYTGTILIALNPWRSLPLRHLRGGRCVGRQVGRWRGDTRRCSGGRSRLRDWSSGSGTDFECAI